MSTDIPVNVEVIDTATGKRAAVDAEHTVWKDEGHVSTFLWAEGNYACDCNRGQLLARALGEDDPDAPCGMKRFLVIITRLDSGEIIVDETEGGSEP